MKVQLYYRDIFYCTIKIKWPLKVETKTLNEITKFKFPMVN